MVVLVQLVVICQTNEIRNQVGDSRSWFVTGSRKSKHASDLNRGRPGSSEGNGVGGVANASTINGGTGFATASSAGVPHWLYVVEG